MRREALSPDLVLAAYSQGIFPMAHPDEDDAIYWYAPDPRAILPLDKVHLSKSLRKVIRSSLYSVTTDLAFDQVIHACADREETWISDEILETYLSLYYQGYGHSIEVWMEEELAGGLYGIALGGAFFAESMFHRRSNAGNIALAAVVHHLNQRGFMLLDVQFSTPHLSRFGVIEIPRIVYERKLEVALARNVSW